MDIEKERERENGKNNNKKFTFEGTSKSRLIFHHVCFHVNFFSFSGGFFVVVLCSIAFFKRSSHIHADLLSAEMYTVDLQHSNFCCIDLVRVYHQLLVGFVPWEWLKNHYLVSVIVWCILMASMQITNYHCIWSYELCGHWIHKSHLLIHTHSHTLTCHKEPNVTRVLKIA